jgi:hypothetical protein
MERQYKIEQHPSRNTTSCNAIIAIKTKGKCPNTPMEGKKYCQLHLVTDFDAVTIESPDWERFVKDEKFEASRRQVFSTDPIPNEVIETD